jgi:Uncharacterized enzymes related to aldose 1-epimerase
LIALQSADGATAALHHHGAHLVSWCPASDGEERLFLSARSEYRRDAAIRGGVPVIFPQFAAEGPLPRHGFARTSEWSLLRTRHLANGAAVATLELRDSPATRAIWPASFVATLTVDILGDALAIGFTVRNVGAQAFTFAAALHTYLRVHDVQRAELAGLRGVRYRESSDPTALVADDADVLHPVGAVDRVYVDAPRTLALREPDRSLDVELTGFPDVVVWNPGAAAAAKLSDMEPGGERHMLCVEAAAVQRPISLAPGELWSGEQRLAARPRR